MVPIVRARLAARATPILTNIAVVGTSAMVPSVDEWIEKVGICRES